MKILVADDDRDLVDLLTYWLKGHGYDVLRAFDGDQAIARWRDGKPDMVILDVEMPKEDGFEVCRKMSGKSNALVLVKTHIRHLRQKVEPEPNAPQYIVTVPGVGYTFMSQAAIETHA